MDAGVLGSFRHAIARVCTERTGQLKLDGSGAPQGGRLGAVAPTGRPEPIGPKRPPPHEI